MSNFMVPWIITVVIVLIGVVIAFMAAKKDMDRNTKRLLLGVIIGVVLLVLVVEFFVYREPSQPREGSEDDDSFPFFILIPIWFGALIPLIAYKKKEGEPTPEEKRRIKIVLIIGLGVLVAGVVAAFVLVA